MGIEDLVVRMYMSGDDLNDELKGFLSSIGLRASAFQKNKWSSATPMGTHRFSYEVKYDADGYGASPDGRINRYRAVFKSTHAQPEQAEEALASFKSDLSKAFNVESQSIKIE